MKRNIAIVLGTRPEIVKLAPIIHACQERRIPYTLIHSGQHYDANMTRVFFDEFKLPQPHVQLSCGGKDRMSQLSYLLDVLPTVFATQKISGVIVQGDTNTVLGAALVAQSQSLPIAHVEAGLRSFDTTMPEETNRVLTDHMSSLLFAPTSLQRSFLRNEGIGASKIFVVGNTIADVLHSQHMKIGVHKNKILLTLHRPATVDDPVFLHRVLTQIDRTARSLHIQVLFPVHPRTRSHLANHTYASVEYVEPLGYQSFIQHEATSALIITDSGGVQEEACILGTPCLTLRTSTERQETVVCRANALISQPEEIKEAIHTALHRRRTWKHPYGTGHAAQKIMDRIEKEWL